MKKSAPIIIIGCGLAGYNVARELRKLDQAIELILIAEGAAHFYSKPMLSNALAKNKKADELVMSNADKMASDLNAKILANTRVDSIDTTESCLFTSNNETLNYSQLVLATGARTIPFNISGNAVDKILSVNDLESYAIFRDAIAEKKKIAIIGAGLIGCEFANDLIVSGYDVSVYGQGEFPLNNLLPVEAGQYLMKSLADEGVNWNFASEITRINYSAESFEITLANGEQHQADVVLSAIGLRPDISLADAAGLTVNKGIVVNDKLESSVKGIYALGDCAEVEGYNLPYVMPLMNAARTLAKNLCGEISPVTYPAMPVLVKTPACALVVAPPQNGVSGNWELKQDEFGVDARFYDIKKELKGFALLGKAVAEKQKLTKELPSILN